jgi:hypothetical protein
MTTIMTTTGSSPLPAPGEDPDRDAPVLARLAALKKMSVKELKAEWRKLFGADAPNNSKRWGGRPPDGIDVPR